MKHDPEDYERTVYGIGYQIKGGGSRSHPRIYTHWRDMLGRFVERGRGYNTLNLSPSWECFDNFRDWFLEKEKGMHKLKSRYLTFLAPEYLPKKMLVGDEVIMIVSPKYGPKTCTLTLVKPPTWRAPYWMEKRVRNKDTEEMEDKMIYCAGTGNAQKTIFPIGVKTKLFRRKVAAVKTWAAYVKVEEDRREEIQRLAHIKQEAVNRRTLKRIGLVNTDRGLQAHYDKVIFPAQDIQLKQLKKARRKEAKRLVGLDDVELRIKQRGIYRGLGYIGEGPYETRVNKVKTRAYNRWMWLLDRCYKNCDRREDSNMYLGYRLGKKFLCFQDFAKWFESVDRPGAPLPTFIVTPNSKGKLVIGPKNTKLMF